MNGEVINKNTTITTLEIADMLGMKHYKILEKLEGTKDGKTKGVIEVLTHHDFVVSDYFIPSTYQDASGKENKCYLVTKLGCDFLANKFTGEKGVIFTAKYVRRFREMEEQLVTRPRPMTALEQLQLQAQAILEVNDKVMAMKTELEDVKQELVEFKQDLPLLAVDQSKITSAVKMRVVAILGGKNSNACNSYYLRSKVFQSLYKDLYSYFAIKSYKAIKRSELSEALYFINDYNPPKHIQQWIADANAQMNLSELEN